jgi:GT2 family glycosyltransferase
MTAATEPDTAGDRVPSVLVVLVVRDAAEWLRETLHALAAQTYPRLGILAIDDASADGSHEILVQALGEGRVVRHEEALGFARSLEATARLSIATGADFLLALHDDAALDPEAVQRLVEATMLPGVEDVGVVGAKVVDWDQQRVLRDIGRSADRFGHPYTPLQAGEIDQGQFDRVLDVFAVDGCALLIRREVWQRVGLLDERLGDDDADLDLCWRVRVAGWRVLMTPLARVRHRAEREREIDGNRRYVEDRAALAATLKNYGPISLLVVVPLGIVLTLVRLLYLLLSRRFEEAIDVLRAVGWNLVHLPGTFARRRVVQRSRRVRDASLRRYTESAGLRIPRWFQTAERIWEEQRELGDEEQGEPVRLRLRHRTASLASTHPVIVASFVGVVIGGFAIRHLLGPEPVVGGVVPAFPDDPSGFFTELVSATRTTGLGGPLAASPALGALGGSSTLLFGSTALAQKALLIGLPALAVVLCYRACVRATGRPGPSVVAASAFGLSAVMLWSFSEGRLGSLVALAATPPLIERIGVAFSEEEPADGRWRLIAGLGVTLAVAVAFWPGVLLAVLVVVLAQLVVGRSRARGLLIAIASLLCALVLNFPFVPTIVAGAGAGLRSSIGTSDPWAVGRLALGEAPGSWAVAWFLPVAAALGFALTTGERRRPAVAAALIALGGLGLAWASGAGWLPAPVTNAPAYVGLAATAEAFLVALGLASALGGLGRAAFGFRQIGSVAIAVVLVGGFVLQGIVAALGEWAVGGAGGLAASWAIVDTGSTDGLRVLWLGDDDGRPFPAPGGDPAGTVDAGAATVRYGLTDRGGTLAIDLGRPLAGPGAAALERSLLEIVGGTTLHGGALLVPFGVGYVIAEEGTLAPEVLATLDAQADLDRVPATELTIYRNAEVLPPAAVVEADRSLERIVTSDDPELIQQWPGIHAQPLDPVEGGWEGFSAGGNLAIVSTEYDGAWELVGTEEAPQRSFGWSTAFPVAGPTVDIRYGGQLPRTVQLWMLGALWAAALWFTRRPVQR